MKSSQNAFYCLLPCFQNGKYAISSCVPHDLVFQSLHVFISSDMHAFLMIFCSYTDHQMAPGGYLISKGSWGLPGGGITYSGQRDGQCTWSDKRGTETWSSYFSKQTKCRTRKWGWYKNCLHPIRREFKKNHHNETLTLWCDTCYLNVDYGKRDDIKSVTSAN